MYASFPDTGPSKKEDTVTVYFIYIVYIFQCNLSLLWPHLSQDPPSLS